MGNFEINIDPPERPGGVVEIRGSGHRSGVIAIVVGLVIVVALAVVVGRSRDKSVAEPPTTTALVDDTTSTTATSTTIAEQNTTTTAAPPSTTEAAVHVYGPLLPDKTGTTLVLLQSNGQLVQVDVDSGTVTDLAPGQRLRNIYEVTVLRKGVVVSGDNRSRLVADGAISNLGFIDPVMGTIDGDHLIGVRYSSTESNLVTLVPGETAESRIKIPAQSEPVALLSGAVVLQARAGGVYRLDLGSGDVRKIADGIFVAGAGDRVASMTCDDALQCRIGIGPLGRVPTHKATVAPAALGYLRSGALSPTSDRLALQTDVQGRLTVVVLDLDTGSVLLNYEGSPSGTTGFSPFVWSADGRWLFWVDLGQVKAWSSERGGEPIAFSNNQAGSAQLIAAGPPP